MRSSLQLVLLFATLLAVAALLGSFVAGLGGGAPSSSIELRADGAEPRRPARAARADEERTRVEVLNGSKLPGLARRATERLRDAGFDVVYFGNGPDADSSLVLDRVGRPDAARAVAEALGIRTVQSRPDPELQLDVTVILGPDWPPQEDARGDEGGPWEKLTGWLRGSGRRRATRRARSARRTAGAA